MHTFTGEEICLIKSGLSTVLSKTVDREPFIAVFSKNCDTVMMVNFHAVPTDKNPAKEIVQLKKICTGNTKFNIIMTGDFNLSQVDSSFIVLKKSGLYSSMQGVKTSLRSKCDAKGIFSQEYDNFYYKKKTLISVESNVINFTTSFATLADARMISDHCPIYIRVVFRRSAK
jgi:deoxyribonuclease-1-like protein